MTRINAGIAVQNLTDEHLLAEHREIKRLPACLIKASSSGALKHVPSKFCLGTGHVTFFLDKGKYTQSRYNDIFNECLKRGFKISDYNNNWNQYPPVYMNQYTPSENDRKLVIDRISTRITQSKKTTFHYYGKPISKEKAIELLCVV